MRRFFHQAARQRRRPARSERGPEPSSTSRTARSTRPRRARRDPALEGQIVEVALRLCALMFVQERIGLLVRADELVVRAFMVEDVAERHRHRTTKGHAARILGAACGCAIEEKSRHAALARSAAPCVRPCTWRSSHERRLRREGHRAAGRRFAGARDDARRLLFLRHVSPTAVAAKARVAARQPGPA
jgi:hypothetical protein